MPNMRDADDALSQARAQVEQWRVEFLQQWTMPYDQAVARAVLMQAAQAIVGNPGMAQYYQQRMPAEFDKLRRTVEQEGQGNNGMGQPGQ